MSPIVPSDLLEYPTIQYFKYRNKGNLIESSVSFIDHYLPYCRKDPRIYFLENFRPKKYFVNWGNPSLRGSFLQSTGQVISPYRPISPILNETKFHPVLQLVTHQYHHKELDRKKDNKSVILIIHGYAESTLYFYELYYLRLFYQVFHSNILILELPYHFHRQPKDSPFSGAYYLNGNPIRMAEAFRQSIQEILYLIKALKENYDRVILFGISLGGHLVALTTQFLTNVDIICGLATPFLFNVNPKVVPISTKTVSQIRKNGNMNYYKILHTCNLKYFFPFTTNRNTVVIGGQYDRIVPFNRVQKLSKMLNIPIIAYPGGHLTLSVWLRPILRKINNFFNNKGY